MLIVDIRINVIMCTVVENVTCHVATMFKPLGEVGEVEQWRVEAVNLKTTVRMRDDNANSVYPVCGGKPSSLTKYNTFGSRLQ